MYILAFETSCDDTSVALFRDDELIAMETDSQIKVHSETGWVVPEVAARLHAESIFKVLDKVLEKGKLKLEDIDYIWVTTNPGLLSSLLTWTSLASTISTVLNIPIIPINHIEAHIFANFLERKQEDIEFPLVTLTVSGGHNDIYYMDTMWDVEKIGSTWDDAAWEAFDKVAKMLGLGYPGWPIISKLSEEYELEMIESMKEKGIMNASDASLFPRVYLKKDEFDFSFSGLKSAVKRVIDKKKLELKENLGSLKDVEIKNIVLPEKDVKEIAFEFEMAVTEVLAYKLLNAAKLYWVKTVMLAWGVSANKRLKAEILNKAGKEGIKFLHPVKNVYSMDNAAMVGINTFYKIKHKRVEPTSGVVAP